MIENEVQMLEQYVSTAPKGKLVCRQRVPGKYDFSYCIHEQNGRKKEAHIPLSKKELALQLAYKEYAIKRLADCKKELYALNCFLSFYGREKETDQYLKSHPGAATLLTPILSSPDEYAKQWQKKPYTRSTNRPEDLIYPTVVPDLKVRSKAEGDIISRFIYFQVPYRYEEQLIINGIVLHPDLTCLNVRTREEFYWEHQGAWDKQNYVSRLSGREDQYRIAGIIPWKNLIITTETANQPLDINWVDLIIQYFLL